MGSRAADTLKDISEIRARLDRTLTELERRLPPMLLGRKALGLVIGGGAGGSVLWWGLRRLAGRRGGKEAAPGVSVTMLPPSSVPAALGVALIWAGVRLYEARLNAKR